MGILRALKALTVFKPSAVIGTLMTMFLCQVAYSKASVIMPSWSSLITSALMGPFTYFVISRMRCLKGICSLAIKVGFVVTPSTIPQAEYFLIASMSAVSRKNFMIGVYMLESFLEILIPKKLKL